MSRYEYLVKREAEMWRSAERFSCDTRLQTFYQNAAIGFRRRRERLSLGEAGQNWLERA